MASAAGKENKRLALYNFATAFKNWDPPSDTKRYLPASSPVNG